MRSVIHCIILCVCDAESHSTQEDTQIACNVRLLESGLKLIIVYSLSRTIIWNAFPCTAAASTLQNHEDGMSVCVRVCVLCSAAAAAAVDDHRHYCRHRQHIYKFYSSAFHTAHISNYGLCVSFNVWLCAVHSTLVASEWMQANERAQWRAHHLNIFAACELWNLRLETTYAYTKTLNWCLLTCECFVVSVFCGIHFVVVQFQSLRSWSLCFDARIFSSLRIILSECIVKVVTFSARNVCA